MSARDSNVDQVLIREGRGKKPYSSPMLSRYGLVRKLTTSGSNPNTEAGAHDNPKQCSQDARSSCLP